MRMSAAVSKSLRRWFQHDFGPRDPNSRAVKYKYPSLYDPYGPRASPAGKIVGLAERIAALSAEDRGEIGRALAQKLSLPKLERVSTEGLGPGPGPGPKAREEKKAAEKTAFDVKLEKFDAAAKIKVIKEVRAFTSLGLKEAKELVEKAPVILKQGLTIEEASRIIQNLKAAGGIATMD